MTTAVDTNVVSALWDKDAATSSAAQNALDAAFHRGTLIAAAPVFAEIIAAPGRSETFVGSFFEETGIGVDWEFTEQIRRLAGRAFRAVCETAPQAARCWRASYSCGLRHWGSCCRQRLSLINPRRSFLWVGFSDSRNRDFLRLSDGALNSRLTSEQRLDH